MAKSNPETKPWWKSSTIWINLIPVSILVLELVVDSNLLPPEWLALAVAILNILNRFRAPSTVKKLSR